MNFTFNDAWASWSNNIPFTIAFLGDSTFAGNNTSSWKESNSITNTKTAFPYLLEKMLQKEFNNTAPTIINSGFSGDNCAIALERLPNLLKNELNTADMIGIGLGINDRIQYPTLLDYRNGFKKDYEKIIKQILSKNITPFIVTCQATVEPGVHTKYLGEYPLRNTSNISIITNKVKEELAEQYNLLLIDINKETEWFLSYSEYNLTELISDQLHFGDIGHKFTAEYFFSIMCPFTILIKKHHKISYLNQYIQTDVPQECLILESHSDFKCYVDYKENNSINTLLFKAILYNNYYGPISLKIFQKNNKISSNYILINGKEILFSESSVKIQNIPVGLVIIEIYSGISNIKSFTGIIIEK